MPDAEGVTLEPHSSCVCPTPIKGLGWVGGWVGVSPPPPPGGGVGHLSVCGYAKILGGWVPELTPPPPRVAKQNPGPTVLRHALGAFCAVAERFCAERRSLQKPAGMAPPSLGFGTTAPRDGLQGPTPVAFSLLGHGATSMGDDLRGT